LVVGSIRSAPTQPVPKMFQPPSSIGFFEARQRLGGADYFAFEGGLDFAKPDAVAGAPGAKPAPRIRILE